MATAGKTSSTQDTHSQSVTSSMSAASRLSNILSGRKTSSKQQTVVHDLFKPPPNPTSGIKHDSKKEKASLLSSIRKKVTGSLPENAVPQESRDTCVVTINRKHVSEETVQVFQDGVGKYSRQEVKEVKNKIKFHLKIHDLVKAVKAKEKILERRSQRIEASRDAQVVEKAKKTQRTEKESSPGLNKISEELCRHLSPNEYKALEYLLGKDFTNAVRSVVKNNGKIVSVCAKNKADKESIDHWLSNLRQESLTLTSEELGKLEGSVDTKSAGVKAFVAVQNNECRVVIHAFDYAAIKTAKHMVEVKSEKRKLIKQRRPDVVIHTNHTFVEQTKDLYTKSGIKVSVYKADITHLPVDAIVNAANGQLNHGGGVAAAIARAAGADLELEGDDYIKTHGPLKVTEVLSTTAGNLPCKRVFHGVGPRWDDYEDKELCQKHLEQTVFNAFRKAHDMMFTSLAVSSISSAIFGVPKEMCARMYLAGIQRFDRQHGGNTSLRHIHFVDVNDDMVGIIQKVFTQFWHSDFQTFLFQRQRDDTNKQNSQTVQVNSSESQKGESSNTKISSTDNSRHYDFKGLTLFLQQQDIPDYPDNVVVAWQEPGCFELDMDQFIKMGGDIKGGIPDFDYIEDGDIKSFTLNNGRIIFFPAMSSESTDADKVSGMTERILDKVQQERKRSVVIPCSLYVQQTVPNSTNNSLEQFCEGIHKGIRRYLEHRNVYVTVDNSEVMNMMADKINLLFGEIKEEEKSRSNDGTYFDQTVGHYSFKPPPNPKRGTTHDSNKQKASLLSSILKKGRLSEKAALPELRETCVVTINRKYVSEETVQAFQDGMGKYSCQEVKEEKNKIKFHLKIQDFVKAVKTIEKILERRSQRTVESKDAQVVEKSKKDLSKRTEKESSPGVNKKSAELCRHLSHHEYKALEYLLGKDFTNAVTSVEKNNNEEIVSIYAKNKADKESINHWISSLRQESLTLTSEELGKLEGSVDTKSVGVKAFIEVQNNECRVVIHAFDYNAIKTAKHMVEVKSEKRKLTKLKRPDVVIHTNHTFVEQTKELYTKSGIKVYVSKADITHLLVDAIVNDANGQLNHGGGVAAAIAKAAGVDLEIEGEDYIKAHGPLKVTEVLSITAGNLPCKRVFHAVGPRWDDYEDKELCQKHLEQTVFNAFRKAHDMMFTSLAVSSISSAIFGVPKEMCARMYLAGIQKFDRQHGGNTSLKHIYFVDVNDEMVGIIQKVFTQFWHSDIQTLFFQSQRDDTNKQNSQTVQVNSSESQKGESSNTKSSSTDNSRHFDFKGITLFLQQQDISDYPEDVVIVAWQEPGCFELDMDQIMKLGCNRNGIIPSFDFIEDGDIESFTEDNGRIIFFPAMSSQSIDADKVSGMTERILDKVQQERKRSVVIPFSSYVQQTVPNSSNNSLEQFCEGIHKGIRRYLEHRNVYVTVDNSEIMNMMADKINLLFGEIKEVEKSRSNDETYFDYTTRPEKVTEKDSDTFAVTVPGESNT